MKCHNVQHFIWVFIVSKSTSLGVSSMQKVNLTTFVLHSGAANIKISPKYFTCG